MSIFTSEISGDGCILNLPFNEGSGTIAYDRSGYNNNGTIYGATWTSGVTGSALSFEGNAYVEVPDDASLDITDEITIEACVKFSASLANNAIAGKFQISPYPYLLYIENNVARFGLNGAGIISAALGTSILNDGKWHHIAGTYDKSLSVDNIKIFVDGVLEGTQNYTTSIFINNDIVAIAQWGGAHFFKGIIDSVRIYNRALSREEIQAHFRGARLLPLRGD